MSFAADWLRRARARHRARMVDFIEGAVAARLAGMKKLTPAEMGAQLEALHDRVILHIPPRHAKTLNVRTLAFDLDAPEWVRVK